MSTGASFVTAHVVHAQVSIQRLNSCTNCHIHTLDACQPQRAVGNTAGCKIIALSDTGQRGGGRLASARFYRDLCTAGGLVTG